MDKYLESAFLPALHRAGISNAGVFKPVKEDEKYGKLILVWIPFESLDEFEKLPSVLDKDKQYIADGQDYIEAVHDNPPYKRIENVLLKAFEGMPGFKLPEHGSPSTEQIFELRSYEGATEKIFKNKVEMFNEAGEIELFVKLGFQPVFFAEVLSSAHMPRLIHMTTFDDSASQEARWKAFQEHPDWIKMKALDRYQNTVSKITKYLMYPTDYSDI